ncbi:hypothetical protein [Nocardia sp. CY41]|uniref:hypothetical protein n=1 Tax=Nocardia sp. CY41 TaxID=2608686 RepID=UPI001F2ED3F6|nr:hypothetical protein [Nocardia sp. CY41]
MNPIVMPDVETTVGIDLRAQLETLAKLREKFEKHQIGLLPKPYSKDAQKGKCGVCKGFHGLPAMHVDYVGHAAVTDRLLDVDPLWNWEPVGVDQNGLPVLDNNGGLWIRLTIAGLTRLGYGDAQGKRGGDAVKEAIGDAIRNAAMRFGVALDLWHKGDLHIESEEQAEAPVDEDPILRARRDLNAAISARGISPNKAKARFAKNGHGQLGASTDVKAIRALVEHYRNGGEE